MKRVLLFVSVNIAVMVTLMVVLNVLLALVGPEVRESLYRDGIDVFGIGLFSLVFGMGGAFISLLISKPMAKLSTGAQVVDGSESEDARWLVSTVERLARAANVKMPEVAIYRGAPNAFATGAFKNSALVAVSDQILAKMSRSELEAVLGHEMSHVVNGDMITLTLVQGVLNAVVLFLARIIAYVVDNALGEKRRRGTSGMYFLVMYLMQILLGLVGVHRGLRILAPPRIRRRRRQCASARYAAADDRRPWTSWRIERRAAPGVAQGVRRERKGAQDEPVRHASIHRGACGCPAAAERTPLRHD